MKLLVRILFTGVSLAYTQLFVHEAMHAWAAVLLGGQATVEYTALLDGVTRWSGVAPERQWLVAGAGGWGAAVFLWLGFGMVPWLTKSADDNYWWIVAYPVSAINMVYGYGEALARYPSASLWWVVPALPWVAGAWWYGRRLVKTLVGGERWRTTFTRRPRKSGS